QPLVRQNQNVPNRHVLFTNSCWPRFKGWTRAGQCVLCLFFGRIGLEAAMETALLVALGLMVGLAIAGLAVFVTRQRTPEADPAAAQLAAEHAAAAQMADQRVV